MELKLLPGVFSVCKAADIRDVNLRQEFCFVGVTDQEISLVCPAEHVPEKTLAREDGWRGLRIEGVLDFSLVGILAKVSACLAAAEVGIFAVSTYNTDYIFMKETQFVKGIGALVEAGYTVTE